MKNRVFLLILVFILTVVGSGSVFAATVTPAPAGFDVYRSNIPHGKMSTITYYSNTVGVNRKAMIYTPPGYSTSKKYNVVYLLHGIGGDEKEWATYVKPEIILDNLYSENKLAQMIVVFPNGRAMKDDRPIGDLYAADKIAAFERFEFDLKNDLIPFIESKYPVIKNRLNRAIGGYSMGGGQTLNFGLGNLNTFAWVGAFAPAPNTKAPAQLVPNPTYTTSMLKLLWLSCGDIDSLKYISDQTDSYLKSKSVPHIYYVDKGGHETKVWRSGLYQYSQRLFK